MFLVCLYDFINIANTVQGEGLLDDLTDLNQEVISALHTQLPRITEENDTDAAIGPSQGQENLANVVPDPFKDILAGMDEIEQVLEAPKEPLQIRRSHPSTINSQDNKLVFSEPENRYSYDGPFFSESASPFEDGLERAIRHNSKDRASRNKEIDERTLSAYLDYTSNIDSFESEFQGDRLSQASKTDMDGAINLLIGNAGKMYGADDSLNAFSQSTMEKELERSLFITNERSGQIEKNENAQRKAQNSKIQRKLDKSGLFSKSLEGHDQQSEDSNDDGPTDKAITPGSIKRSSKLFDDDEDDTDHGDDIHAIVKAGALKRASNYDANLPTVREGDGEKASERKVKVSMETAFICYNVHSFLLGHGIPRVYRQI